MPIICGYCQIAATIGDFARQIMSFPLSFFFFLLASLVYSLKRCLPFTQSCPLLTTHFALFGFLVHFGSLRQIS